MAYDTIAILSPGEMGNGVGNALVRHGHRVITCLAGRSEQTKARAERGGFEVVDDLETLVKEAQLILSIVPPEFAVDTARDVAAAMKSAGATPPFADCNAIAPPTAHAAQAVIEEVGAVFVDAGIVGFPPGKTDTPARFYTSGKEAAILDVLDGKDIIVTNCGPEVGTASAVKMCYSSINKGTNALHAAAMTAAEALGVRDIVSAELEQFSPQVLQRMRNNISRLPADSGRFVPEMEEIAKTYAAVGVSPNFHLGARDIYAFMESTPLSAETRETMDTSRTLEETLRIFADHLPKSTREAAE